MKSKYNDPLLQYCEWASKRVSSEVLVGILCVGMLIAAFVW